MFKTNAPLSIPSLIVLSFLLGGAGVRAATITWTGGGADDSRHPASHWDLAHVSASEASVVIAQPSTGPTGACCFADGSCRLVTQDACTGAGGTYQGDNTVCQPNPCPPAPPDGACCFVTGDCFVLPTEACAEANGSYHGDDTTCNPNPCPQPPPLTGACCFRNANCRILSQTRCEQLRGVYLEDGTVCAPDPCGQLKFPRDPADVATEQISWGHIKSTYR